MPLNTTYSPVRNDEFEASKLLLDARGACLLCTPNTSNNLDLAIADDSLITGIHLKSTDSTLGDTITLRVVDINNVLGYGANAVIRQFGTNWCLVNGTNEVFVQAQYPAKIFGGLYLRVVYNSVSLTVAPSVAANYVLHKVLV